MNNDSANKTALRERLYHAMSKHMYGNVRDKNSIHLRAYRDTALSDIKSGLRENTISEDEVDEILDLVAEDLKKTLGHIESEEHSQIQKLKYISGMIGRVLYNIRKHT